MTTDSILDVYEIAGAIEELSKAAAPGLRIILVLLARKLREIGERMENEGE